MFAFGKDIEAIVDSYASVKVITSAGILMRNSSTALIQERQNIIS